MSCASALRLLVLLFFTCASRWLETFLLRLLLLEVKSKKNMRHSRKTIYSFITLER